MTTTTLQHWIEAPLALGLGRALVHFVWEGAAVAALLAALLQARRMGSSRVRYNLAVAALLAMPLAFGVTLALCVPTGSNATIVSLAPLRHGHAIPSAMPDFAPAGMFDQVSWLVPLWIAGVLFCYVRILTSWLAALRLRRVGVCAAPDAWQARLDELAAQLKLSRPVMLLESCLAEVPVVIGWFRPVILAPLGLLAGLPAGQVEAILIHELAHIRRYDYAVNLLQGFVEGLLFYHPAVWWISRTVRTERENCCDDEVVAQRSDVRTYAAALATLEQNRSTTGEAVLAATGGNLLNRISRLLGKPTRTPNIVVPVFAIALLLIAVGSSIHALTPAADMPARYQKWLSEDVVYIITTPERDAFVALKTDADRNYFIEQFWLRRDPTPGTPENEFKEEHYRRIAYANQRFDEGKAGWRSDRGRIYIIYGPPDEIEAHPRGGYQRPPERGGGYVEYAYPWEQWLYHYIEGLGKNVLVEFDDTKRSGEYKLVSGAVQ